MELERALVQRLVADIPIAGNSLCIAEMNRRAEALGISKPAPKSSSKRKANPAVEDLSDSDDDLATPQKEKEDSVPPKSSEKTKAKKNKKEDKTDKTEKKTKEKEKKEKKHKK